MWSLIIYSMHIVVHTLFVKCDGCLVCLYIWSCAICTAMKGDIYSYFSCNKIQIWYIHALVSTNIFSARVVCRYIKIPSLYRFLSAIQIRRKLRLGVIPLLAIRSQHFCTYHDSTALVLCIQFRRNHCIRIEVRVKRNFHRICIAMKKLVKRAHILNSLSSKESCHANMRSLETARFDV